MMKGLIILSILFSNTALASFNIEDFENFNSRLIEHMDSLDSNTKEKLLNRIQGSGQLASIGRGRCRNCAKPVYCLHTRRAKVRALKKAGYRMTKRIYSLPDSNDLVKWRKCSKLGQIIGRYSGVTAHVNNLKQYWKDKYQCTELSHRFTREVFKIPSSVGGMGHGNIVSRCIGKKFMGTVSSTPLNKNGDRVTLSYEKAYSINPPVNGSVLSFGGGVYGHTAVVKKVEKLSNIKIRLTLFEQNMSYKSKKQNSYLCANARTIILNKDSKGRWIDKQKKLVGWLIPRVVERITP